MKLKFGYYPTEEELRDLYGGDTSLVQEIGGFTEEKDEIESEDFVPF